MPKKEFKRYDWYFILAIIYAALSIFINILAFIPIAGMLFVITFAPFSLIWLIISTIVLIIFIKNKYPKKYLVLPIFYLVMYLIIIPLLILAGMYSFGMVLGGSENMAIVWVILGFGYASIAFQIGYSLYVLLKK